MGITTKNIVVIGNGMVGHRFCEKLVEFGGLELFNVTVLGEEPRLPYDRVHLTEYFDPEKGESSLQLCDSNWYAENGIELRPGVRATEIDRVGQLIHTNDRESPIEYNVLVIATGSAPFIPPIPGIDKKGVFAYRTIEDLDAIMAYSRISRKAAVMGGGLLGLEAAKAVVDLGLETHVVEFAPRLMPRQLDEPGAEMLKSKIESMGVNIHLSKQTMVVLGNDTTEGLLFAGGESLDVDMLVVSAGIRPRDELARTCGLKTGDRGGIIVDDSLRTNDPNIFAIGEVALHREMIYGLVGPGYRMAEVVASNLLGDTLNFTGWDMSTKLKLMGVDVASFGNPFEEEGTQDVLIRDEAAGVYKKLVVDPESNTLIGGILVGDASDYAKFLHLATKAVPLDRSASALLFGSPGGSTRANDLPDDIVACSCNNVSKGAICTAIDEHELTTLAQVKTCTGAGTGCGGCMPMVADILTAQLNASGKSVKKVVCEHFAYSRQELLGIIKMKKIYTYNDLLSQHGSGEGCEVCKPLVASLLASTWNDLILKHDTIQDTNDKFLANIQQGGTYSVIPRVPGGEPTANDLMVLGQVAKKYNLYCKITGGQRIGMYGARVDQLPHIWAELIAAGFESGHAYGKALRTVKSCVGTSWCRFGVQDSTTMAIDVENRYKGLRSPHKLKSAVSGCTRECAEAQSKDFGFIATEKGWNLYVCGNGGTKPRHADLLANDVSTEWAIRYMDRFLMYYVRTADPLTRTARWVEKLEGGIDHIRDVVIDDTLGIAEDLEAEMEAIVQSYTCEWKDVVENPEKLKRFSHFANDDAPDESIRFEEVRDQIQTPEWAKDSEITDSPSDGEAIVIRKGMENAKHWWEAGDATTFPENGGVALKYGNVQIALFHFATRDTWYATQNLCPHKKDMVLSRGLTGDLGGIPKVACPHHKKQFSLDSGECLSGESYAIKTFPVRVREGRVEIELPVEEALLGSACDQTTVCDSLAESVNAGV